ncbi:MAG: transcriptional repressor [Propionibacterium sp.]|nr:transcriptional repressor [Propionibacterium sp.]
MTSSHGPVTGTDPHEQLRRAGLRVTAPRLAVLDVVAERQHAETDEIATAVRERLGSVSTQAVYGVLQALTDAGLLRRVSTGSRSASRYEVHHHDNHHHLLCRMCGRLEDVACVVGEAPCLEPSDDHGFTIEAVDVLFRGVCPSCRELAAATDPPDGS